jgi:hypothetical protein
MKSTEIIDRNVLSERRLTELADQVDPAIGEASSVIGAMTTEIVRRSLRGGVLQIGRELSAFVGQEVDLQIAEQRPVIEKTAAITATEVARGEVEAVRQAASEQAQRLSARIDDATRLAQEEAKTVARDLAARLEETSRLAQEQTQSIARDLTGRLEETSKKAHQQIEIVAKVADDTARQTNEATTSLSRTLQTEVAAVETRTLNATRTEFTAQIEQLKDRSRQTTQKIVERLNKQDVTTTHLSKVQSELKQELLSTLQVNQKRLLQQIDDFRRANEALAKRLEILERPRGLQAFFARFFGKKKKRKKKPSETATDDTQRSEVE